jgi:uncharacterized protein YjiS (DUF1127 family)
MLNSITGTVSTNSSMSLPSKISGFAASVWHTYRLRRRHRATVRMLRELDERTLNDIGLSRSETDSIWLSHHSIR